MFVHFSYVKEETKKSTKMQSTSELAANLPGQSPFPHKKGLVFMRSWSTGSVVTTFPDIMEYGSTPCI